MSPDRYRTGAEAVAGKPRVWLVTIWEPLPHVDHNPRVLRAGLLADMLVRHGCDVTWWASTFDRALRRQRFNEDQSVMVSSSFRLELLHAAGYSRNVSLARIRYHRALAAKFEERTVDSAPPDIIVCSMPPVEMAGAVARYAVSRRIPFVLDVRDPWPDLLLEVIPPAFRSTARVLLRPMYRELEFAAREADAIFAVSNGLLQYAIDHAGRSLSPDDVVYRLGYAAQTPAPTMLENAREFWRAKGVASDRREFIACYFGMMGRHSDLDTVLDAAELLRDDSRRVKLVLCGDGDRANEFRERASRLDNVVFAGWVDAAAIWTLMRMSAIGIAPYTATGALERCLPNKPIEYLSAGLPVISSLAGETASLLADADCGLTYKPGDAQALLRAIITLHDDSDRRRRMADNAERLYREMFVADEVYLRMAQHVVALAGNRRTASTDRSTTGARGV